MAEREPPDFTLAVCPVPVSEQPTIQLAHGGGGRMSQRLIEGLFVRRFANAWLSELHDGARLDVGSARLALATDSYVVQPLFFPGGDIGSLAVHGTVNDLCMCGARPLYLTAGFILEEGFELASLERIVESMARAAELSGVSIVTGDTKVVDRGKGDGVYINTAGVGSIAPGIEISPALARPGDRVLLSGTIAEHGMAVLAAREALGLEGQLVSDSAPLNGLVAHLLARLGVQVHVLRDPTRGGVASALNEIARSARVGIRLEEPLIPLSGPVRGACELLGLDPLYVANEGKCLAIVAREAASAALEAMHEHELGRAAVIVGEVVADHPARVVVRGSFGSTRVLDMLSGEQFPRIC
ncbi:hydrogenase expression/formation protein HypE [Myxococcota bacterium]